MATAVLLEGIEKKRHRKEVYDLDILQLLYIAERNYLAKEGAMFIGGEIYAMQHGPVHGSVFDLIRGIDAPRSDEWTRYIQILPETHSVKRICHPENIRLWREELIELSEGVELYCLMNKYNYDWEDGDLAKLTLSFPEWKKYKPAKNQKRRLIPWEEILKVQDREDLIAYAYRNFEIENMVQKILAEVFRQ
ncbi:MAG: SocA family protein [Planctomycetaceae bacterium]|jgi:hypothetical protein|nr:SocA family protein [Planctomycetaceae bacterium]